MEGRAQKKDCLNRLQSADRMRQPLYVRFVCFSALVSQRIGRKSVSRNLAQRALRIARFGLGHDLFCCAHATAGCADSACLQTEGETAARMSFRSSMVQPLVP